MNETEYDRFLHIETCGSNNGIYQSIHYNRYEPTPYSALEELLKNYQINENDSIVDFGCGLGRLSIFLHYKTNASVLGIDMNEQFIKEAMKNRERYCKKFKKRKIKSSFSAVSLKITQFNRQKINFIFSTLFLCRYL